jgi:hypothetical protein
MTNWTVPPRSIATFMAVLLLMAGMAAVAHPRLGDIHDEAHQVQVDSVLGWYFSAEAMSNWPAGAAIGRLCRLDGQDKFPEEVRRVAQEVRTARGQLAQILDQVQAPTPRIGTVNEVRQTADSVRQWNEPIQQLNAVTGGLQRGVAWCKIRVPTASWHAC